MTLCSCPTGRGGRSHTSMQYTCECCVSFSRQYVLSECDHLLRSNSCIASFFWCPSFWYMWCRSSGRHCSDLIETAEHGRHRRIKENASFCHIVPSFRHIVPSFCHIVPSFCYIIHFNTVSWPYLLVFCWVVALPPLAWLCLQSDDPHCGMYICEF